MDSRRASVGKGSVGGGARKPRLAEPNWARAPVRSPSLQALFFIFCIATVNSQVQEVKELF